MESFYNVAVSKKKKRRLEDLTHPPARGVASLRASKLTYRTHYRLLDRCLSRQSFRAGSPAGVPAHLFVPGRCAGASPEPPRKCPPCPGRRGLLPPGDRKTTV